MLFTRTSALIVGGGILAAVIASPALMRTTPRGLTEPSRPFVVESSVPEIAPTRVGILMARRTAAAQTSRNPFVFATRPQPAPPAPKPMAAPAIEEPPAPPPRPPITLSAIAAQAGENGAMVRTAVLSIGDQVFLVKEGERATSRFTIVRISDDVVELRDELAGTLFRLALK